MESIIKRALGSDFDKLHPKMQKRFGMKSGDGLYSVCTGVMEEIWNKGAVMKPMLSIGSRRNFMVPELGENIPFTLDNYCYTDSFGREAMIYVRKFKFPHIERRFDTVMVYSDRKGRPVDYQGSRHDMVIDLDISVLDNGGLRIRSGDGKLLLGPLHVPMPAALTGTFTGDGFYDEDEGRFRIQVEVRNALMGPLFRYRGYYETEYFDVEPGELPEEYRPLREDSRE